MSTFSKRFLTKVNSAPADSARGHSFRPPVEGHVISGAAQADDVNMTGTGAPSIDLSAAAPAA